MIFAGAITDSKRKKEPARVKRTGRMSAKSARRLLLLRAMSSSTKGSHSAGQQSSLVSPATTVATVLAVDHPADASQARRTSKKHVSQDVINLVLDYVKNSKLKHPKTGNITKELVREVEVHYKVKESTLRDWLKNDGKRDKSGRKEYLNATDVQVLLGAVKLAGQHNAVVDVKRCCEMV